MDLAAPVDVGGCGKEPQGRAMSARLAVPVLRRDQGLDLLAQLHSPARFGLGGPQHRPRRIPLRHLDGAPVVIDRDKDIRQSKACSTRPPRGLPEDTSTTIVMLDRPVSTSWADTSTRSPTWTGRWKSMFPT